MATTISLAIHKGGVGKTTTAISIAHYLSILGKRVLLIDLDQQRNSTAVFMPDYKLLAENSTSAALMSADIPLPIYPTRFENLDIVPAHKSLVDAEVKLASLLEGRNRLKLELENIQDKYDFIIIDCPPNLGFLPINAFTASDYVMIPVEMGKDELEGLETLVDNVANVKRKLNSQLNVLGIVYNNSDSRPNIHKQLLAQLKDKYGDLVFSTVIPKNIKIAEAKALDLTIYEYAPQSNVAANFQKLTFELIERIKNG